MKGKNIFMIILGVILLVSILLYFNISAPLSISLVQDSIIMDMVDRDSTVIEVDDEVNPYDTMTLTINSIDGSSVFERGADPTSYFMTYDDGAYLGRPGTACYLDASKDQCCKHLGYDRFYSDSGWNICIKNSNIQPEYVKISVGGFEVYSWDGVGDFETTSDNFAETVNEQCGLNDPLQSCSDTNYAIDTDDNTCKYFQPLTDGETCTNAQATSLGTYTENPDFIVCTMNIEDKVRTDNCEVTVSVDTGNNYGVINMALNVDGEGSPDSVTLVEPPETSIECSSTIACEEGLVCDTDSTCIEDEVEEEEQTLLVRVGTYLEDNTLFVSIISAIIFIGGILIYVKRK